MKRERPETDDFAIKKYLVVKEKFFVEISIFQEIMRNVLSGTLTKKDRKGLCIFLRFRTFQTFLIFSLQKLSDSTTNKTKYFLYTYIYRGRGELYIFLNLNPYTFTGVLSLEGEEENKDSNVNNVFAEHQKVECRNTQKAFYI